MSTVNPEKKVIDLNTISEVSQDYKLLQARNSKEFVATMVDICTAINGCPMGKMMNLDVDELKNQTGHILFYSIKGVPDPIPCDVEFVTQLYSHFRKPTILVLKRIQRFLMATHRRILGRLEREQALEKIMDMGAFDVSQKIRLALEEIKRYEKMTRIVRGGGRKLDILMQALKVPSRARFELLLVDRILRDPHHLRHDEAMKWLEKSKFKGNRNAVHSLINNGFQMLDTAANRILDIMEDLSGLKFSRDNAEIDVHQNWYSLGNSLPRGEEFVKSFTMEEQVESKIKRLTFPMVRVAWDAERLRAHMDRLLVDLNVVKIQAAQLSNLFFDLEKKISGTSKPDGEVMVAIENDFQNGMLSIREREDAELWVRENKIKLQQLMMDIYQNLHELKEKNPDLALAQELEETIEQVKSGHATDRDEHRKEVEQDLGNVNINDLIKATERLEPRLEHQDGSLLSDLAKVRADISARIDHISIKNIDFHKKVRDAFQELDEYENKVLELYKMEEQLELMRVTVEGWLLNAYRTISFDQIAEKDLTAALEVVVEKMLLGVRKLDYEGVDAATFHKFLAEAGTMSGDNQVRHLDQLLQEINAVPRSEQLLGALKDWEKDLSREKLNEKETFILDNDHNLQEVAEKARAELRELLMNSDKPQPRRLRFEVFGLSDCLAENLRTLLKGLMASAPRLANVQEGEQLIRSLQALEAQIIEAQKMTKPGGDALKKLRQMEAGKQLSASLTQELTGEMKRNFSDLDQILEETSQALKTVNLMQNRFGAKKDTDYLDVTLNINDLERLKNVYDFIETITMEDIKRFCISYNLKSALINNLFEKARKKDLSVPKEILEMFNTKAYKAFKEKRFISSPLKVCILKNSQEVLESECQLLCHTLNLVNPMNIRKKASYLGVITLMEKASEVDPATLKLLGLLWGRMQTRMFKFKPINHTKNYEGNRQALIIDVNEIVGDRFKR